VGRIIGAKTRESQLPGWKSWDLRVLGAPSWHDSRTIQAGKFQRKIEN
jgi:hypothetical protein